jgi:ABC-2 type transport system ATP-binding protein
MSTAINAQALTKKFGSKLAINNLSMSVETGKVYGFLGPNGAGKTTFIRCLMDFIRPTSGSLTVLGNDPVDSLANRTRIGYLSADEALYGKWTGGQHIEFVSAARSMTSDAGLALAGDFELDVTVRANELSSGNKQKLSLVLAVMHQPDLLILDEPTRGLDPMLQQEVYDLIKDFKARGSTVFMSSHNLAEVDKVCNQIGVIRSGQLVADETIESIKGKQIHKITVVFAKAFKGAGALRSNSNVRLNEVSSNRLSIEVSGDLYPILKLITSQKVIDLEVTHASLDEIFMRYYHD